MPHSSDPDIQFEAVGAAMSVLWNCSEQLDAKVRENPTPPQRRE
ncbi:hypothetical protein [Streptomyces sp. NPDC005955]